ncbi:ATP-NAD kinase family protein [Anoxynatronum sibiricum]|uniref:ATP-NAD kinase family protein n=1 Tax=Anoxynatronum sibiricum TaxID=210623 RepID=A0ABU9VUF3_9CLOT
MLKLGLIINPVAGMGGAVGLKGTDGVLEEALARGAVPRAGARASRALEVLLSLKKEMVILTPAGDMGEVIVKELGFGCQLLSPGNSKRINDVGMKNEPGASHSTTSEDTRHAARELMETGVSLILFVGGDGTARDVYAAVGEKVSVVGVPAGVKIHSPVYALSPEKAGEMARRFLRREIAQLKSEEVLDIDEAAYRRGSVSTRLYGYLRVPDEARLMQGRKSGSSLADEGAQKAIALRVVDSMAPDVVYVIGPGSTTRQVMAALDLPATLLGVDLVLNRRLVGSDATEKEILTAIKGKECRLVITPIGGQGYIFGRGNQQLSPAVIRQAGREHVTIMAALTKINALGGKPLMVDTGDESLDLELEGYYKVMTGYKDSIMYSVKRS